MNNLKHAYYNSPIGLIYIIANDDAIIHCSFEKQKLAQEIFTPFLKKVMEQLDEYFQGRRIDFDLSLNASGSDFQRKVWEILLGVPFGTTITYTELANKIGNAKAIRAVASANAKNPISVIVPCHRVIGRDGKLRGYGGGLERKRWLIDFEYQTKLKRESEKAL